MTAATLQTHIKGIEYGSAPISQFRVTNAPQDKKGKRTVHTMEINGRPVAPTERFWTSLCSTFSNYGLTTKLFKLFNHDEVFERLSRELANRDERINYTLEDLGEGNPRLLGIATPDKPIVEYSKIQETLARYGAERVEYANGAGVIRSTHTPNHMDNFKISGDEFSNRYVMETPIDGFGSPLIYLSLLRLVCTNGAIGYSRAFRSEINLGKNGKDDPMFTIHRSLDSFSNEEGFAAMQTRFQQATKSWASINECNRVHQLMTKMYERSMFHEPAAGVKSNIIAEFARRRQAVLKVDGTNNPVNLTLQRAYIGLTGDLCAMYGIAHLDALSRKKMASLPARCTVYDLINFATEAATHYCSQKDGRLLQAEVGSMITGEYDLEGSRDVKSDFQEWFTDLSTSPVIAG